MVTDYLRTLFLHPPSADGFDGGAGSRYQAKREIRSFWYPTWLAQPAALVPGSRLVDAPPDGLTVDDVLPLAPRLRPLRHAHQHALVRLRRAGGGGAQGREPRARHRAWWAPRWRWPRRPRSGASAALAFVARNEFDFTIQEVAQGRPLRGRAGLSYRGERARGAHPGAPDAREHGRAALRDAGLQARPHRRALRDRLPPAIRTCRSTPGAAAARSAPSASGPRRWAASATARAASSTWPRRWRRPRGCSRR